jgi:hypothetical protein
VCTIGPVQFCTLMFFIESYFLAWHFEMVIVHSHRQSSTRQIQHSGEIWTHDTACDCSRRIWAGMTSQSSTMIPAVDHAAGSEDRDSKEWRLCAGSAPVGPRGRRCRRRELPGRDRRSRAHGATARPFRNVVFLS